MKSLPMVTVSRVIFLGILTLPLLTLGCEDDQAGDYIRGTVTKCDDGAPVEGALVCAEVPGVTSGITNCDTTDAQGLFHLQVGWEGALRRTFLVVAKKDGFEPEEELVEATDSLEADLARPKEVHLCLEQVSP